MKTLLCAILLVCFTGSHLSGTAQNRAQVSRIKIHLAPTDFKKLQQTGIDFDHGHYDRATSTYINEIEYSGVAKIRKLGFRVDILVKDVFAYTDSLNRVESPYKYDKKPVRIPSQYKNLRLNFTSPTQNYETYVTTPSSFVLGSMGGFYNLTELEAQIDDMVADYPGLVTKSSLTGTTLQGRPIWVVKISDNAGTDEPEPEMLYTGMHHAREGMSMMNLIFFMRYILQNYSSNTNIKDLIDSRELFFIPVVNIDGFNYNTTASNWSAGRRMRRKNMAETTASGINADGSGGDGVDINRNYPVYWGSAYEATTVGGQFGSSGTGSADAYRGPSANSEPETQVMMNYVNSRNFKIALNYHAYSNLWIRPQGPDPGSHAGVLLGASAISTYNSLGALLSKYNCYEYGTPSEVLYAVNGYSDDWFFSGAGHSPIYAFSPEVGATADGFWCPQANIIPYAKELVFANLQAAYSAGSYAELQDNGDADLSVSGGSLSYTVTRKGLTDGAITVTLIPIDNMTSGGTYTIPAGTIASFGGTYSGTISYTLPGTPAPGTPIRYKWRVQTGGITIEETVTKLYNPTVVMNDDMEGANYATKWTRVGTGSAWDYAASSGFGGSKSLTESPSGNYANSADHAIRLATALDLSSCTQAYLSFMVKYASENCMDRLQVEISTGGVAGTYTPVSTNQTIVENRGLLANVPSLTGSTDGWVREIINLTPYAGNNNIGLRFRFRSDGTNSPGYSRDGFNIDNFKVVKTAASILPVSFEDINATRSGDVVIVNWKSAVDNDFDYYEIQRSTNGVDFETIGTVADEKVNTHTDRHPANGYNYYRIKAVGKSGQEKYSKTVLVVVAENMYITAYPNPLKDVLNLELTVAQTSNAVVEISTADGRTVYKKKLALQQGNNIHRADASAWANQLYIVKISDETGTILKTFKIVKNGR